MNFCVNCGAKLPENASFCENCGTRVGAVPDDAPSPELSVQGQTVGDSGNIKLCPDGKYRWIYELPMMRNPVALFTIWKVLAISVLLPAGIVFIGDLSNGVLPALLTFFKVYLLVMAILIVVSLIGYTVVAATYGWKYIVLFEMDDKQVVHAQQEKQFKKAEAMGWLTAAAGLAARRPGVAGTGILAATKSSTTTVFKNASSVVGQRRLNTIKVNQLLAKNQVYVDKADYDFVWEYITSRCTKAKVK